MDNNHYRVKTIRCCKCMCFALGIVCVLVCLLLIVSISIHHTPENSYISSVETTTLSKLEKFNRDEKYLHLDHSQGDLSSNVFYRLLYEYVEMMNVRECYVCTQIPSSVQEGVTYHSLPLTYGVSCSLLLTRLYNQEYIQYFYYNLDVVFSFVPINQHLSNIAKERNIDSVGGFFERTLTFGTAYAYHNNLTCLLSPVEKSFLDQTDDRRKAWKEKVEKGLVKRTFRNDYAFSETKIRGKLALDAQHVGKLCIYRPQSKFNTNFVGTSECRRVFLFKNTWDFMLNGQDPVIPGVIIKNLTDSNSDLKDLKEPGLWENVGKSVTNVRNWLGNLGKGIVGKLLRPLLMVITCVICTIGFYILYKLIKRKKLKNDQRREELRLEKLRSKQFYDLRQTENWRITRKNRY